MTQLYGVATVAEAYRSAFKSFGPRVALRSMDGACWTYTELEQRVHRMVRYFVSLGLKRQDGLAVLTANHPDALVVIIASSMMGLRYTALHPMGALEDQAFVLEDAKIAALVVDTQRFAERGLQLKARGLVQHVLSLGPAACGPDVVADSAAFDGSDIALEVQPDDVAKISYTGGTTGRSKGVIHLQRTTITMTWLQLACWEWPVQTRFLVATPISHAGGAMVLPTFLRGGEVLLLERFSPTAFLEAVQTHRITASFLVPTQIYSLLDCPALDDYDPSSLEYVLYGASPIAPARLQEAVQRFGPIWGQLYGQAEAPMTINYLRKDEHDLRRPHLLQSCGRPMLGNQVQLLDAQLQPVTPGEVGELCVRSPLTMAGYLNRPEETTKVFDGEWLHTGDLARQDAEGYLYLVDRAKDMIISGGFNVYSSEVEACLAQHAAVAQSAVIGVPDAKWGEAVVAFVVLKPGAAAQAEELMQFVHQHKGAINAPKQVLMEAELPVTTIGKIDKKTLRARFWDGQGRAIG